MGSSRILAVVAAKMKMSMGWVSGFFGGVLRRLGGGTRGGEVGGCCVYGGAGVREDVLQELHCRKCLKKVETSWLRRRELQAVDSDCLVLG